jgi:cobalt-zinc-cadmium efflux system outer membrane protein
VCAFAVIIFLFIAATPPATAQHEGHDMSKMPDMPMPKKANKQKAKPKPKRAQGKSRARRPARRVAAPAAGHDMNMSMPGHDMQGHEGHQARPTAAPGQPAMEMPSMGGQQMNRQQQEQTPMQGHEGMTHQTPQSGGQQQSMPDMRHQMPGMEMPGMSQPAPQATPEPVGPVMRLEELEQMALQNNPTLAQAEASIRAAQGRRRQSGMFPNPVVGYQGEEFAFRDFSNKAEHFFFVEQTIPLGGKLGKAKRVFAREVEQAEALSEGQRLRVLNSVRVLYYDALGAQRLVDLRRDLARLSREAVGITQELYNVGQADRPDQLEIEIESQRAEIDMLRAENEREQAWRTLAAMVGKPDLQPARLAGSLEESVNALDEQKILAAMLGGSPEIKSAQIGVERARAALERARAQRVPDLFLRGGIGYSSEFLEGPTGATGRRTGPEANVQVGVTLPVFNRNQGGIAEAEANVAIAEREQERLQLVLRSRFSSAFREYRNAVQMAEKYRTEVIPRARKAYEMYLGNYQQMAAAYPQVIIAQRTLFQVEVEYARALVGVRQSGVNLRGFLLSGGLDAAGMSGERTEGMRLRAGSEATGDSDNR